jgi:cellulose synthase/poly-beta-1,6-N-acetylglucosamine synthase-like glycosyltransferase
MACIDPSEPTTDGTADRVLPLVTAETRLLLSLGFRPQLLAATQTLAHDRGTTIAEELIRLGYLAADGWWSRIAQDLDVRYFADLYLEARPVHVPPPNARLFRRVRQVWYRKSDLALLIVAPLGREIDRLRHDIAAEPSLRRRIAIARPQVIRRAFRLSYEPALTQQAIDRLRDEQPDMSAADGAGLTRRFLLCLAAAMVLSWVFPLAMLSLLDLLLLTAGGLRLAAAIGRGGLRDAPSLPDSKLPTYTVLVPLFREARVVGDLIRALERIDYPRGRLFVSLVVEADDRETLSTAAFLTRGTHIRVIAVPPSKPRTKPKALTWALPLAEGELLTVYDAEDRPAPDQLRRAAATFATGGSDLMCVQAMLDVDHVGVSRNWLARQFALEYRVLFRALLPCLSRKGVFFPLGGTSNHFRREALVRIGGWDPFNVTEDADISVRVARAGGRIDVIASVTSEEAPVTWRAWHLQRTRWMKGWLQTWLVHMRNPLKLAKDLGPRSFVTFQALILGQVLSALVCPIGIGLIALDLAGLIPLFADRDFGGDLLLALQLVSLFCGWTGAAAALIAISGTSGRMVRRLDLFTVPAYWLLLFGAAVAAMFELIVDPHRWNKTGHGIAERTPEPGTIRFPPRSPATLSPPLVRPPLPRPPRYSLVREGPPPPRPRKDR